MSEFDVIVLFN